ncbi:MAG: hypothetical protein WCP55_26055 [Lentisphaerota bacterium]
MKKKLELDLKTNYIYAWFTWTANNCSPNRDGGTGEIRVDSHRRVFTTQECFNQIVRNGVFFAVQSGLVPNGKAELMGCKNVNFGPRTLKGAGKDLIKRIAVAEKIEEKNVGKEQVFKHSFDIPLFGLVNSNGFDNEGLPESLTGSAGLIYLPKTVTQVLVENRGISNAFSQPESKDSEVAKKMPGSHYTDYLVEGVFSTLAFVNVKQLEFVAEQKFGMTDKAKIRERIAELVNLYLMGIWEGFKLLGYVSSMRKGQQPLAMFAAQRTTLADYVSDPSDLLSDDKGTIPMHNNIPDTISKLKVKFDSWKKVFDETDMKGMALLEKSSPWGE